MIVLLTQRKYRRVCIILVVLFVFALGCAKTHDKGKTEPKGFISDVSMLEEDPEGKVSLVFMRMIIN